MPKSKGSKNKKVKPFEEFQAELQDETQTTEESKKHLEEKLKKKAAEAELKHLEQEAAEAAEREKIERTNSEKHAAATKQQEDLEAKVEQNKHEMDDYKNVVDAEASRLEQENVELHREIMAVQKELGLAQEALRAHQQDSHYTERKLAEADAMSAEYTSIREDVEKMIRAASENDILTLKTQERCKEMEQKLDANDPDWRTKEVIWMCSFQQTLDKCVLTQHNFFHRWIGEGAGRPCQRSLCSSHFPAEKN